MSKLDITLNKGTFGLWKVTTEGDCEGRSTRNLGTHEGHIDEIALALASQCFYSLTFERVEPITVKGKYEPTRGEVFVTLGIESGTWDLGPDKRVEFAQKLFKDRPVEIERGQYYASIKIKAPNPDDIRKNELRRNAIAKLSPDEIDVLGLS